MYELDVVQTHHGHDDYAEKKEMKARVGKRECLEGGRDE